MQPCDHAVPNTHPNACKHSDWETIVWSLLDLAAKYNIGVKNKKGEGMSHSCEICVLSAHFNNDSWDDKAMPLSVFFTSPFCPLFLSIHLSLQNPICRYTLSLPYAYHLTHVFHFYIFPVSKDNANCSWHQWQPKKAAPEGMEEQDTHKSVRNIQI